MIIGIDASRANRDHKTGTEWYSYYLIRELARLDAENKYILYTDKPLVGGLMDLTVDPFGPGWSPSEIEYDRYGYQIICSPHDNFRAKTLKWPFTYFWTQGRLSLEMMKRPVDVLFVPAHTLPLIHPRRSVVTIHDIGYDRTFAAYENLHIIKSSGHRRRFLNLLTWLFTRGRYRATAVDYLRWSTEFALDKADRIIAISEYTKRDIEQFYRAKSEKIRVVYNGFNQSLYRPINDREIVDKVLAKYGLERPYLFYIGRIERKKNIPNLIEAFAILKEKNPQIKEKLLLVGDASYGYDESKYMIREFDLVNDVILPGWIDEIDIPYIYNGATAFVFPSLYEGFGIPLMQAMACGVPVAASDVTSLPEVAGGAALFFNPNYSLSIADALAKVITDKKLREELIRKGIERAKHFSWEKTAEKTLDIITYKSS